MFGNHFYNEHTRRAVSVFGTLFNNITVVKRDGSGNALQQIKVPLSYGPREKFLARIRQEQNLSDPRLAIKLPRMSFEITGLEYDESTRLTRGTKLNVPGTSATSRRTMFYPSTYNLSFQLSIMSNRRSLVYTLDFDTRIKYYGPLTESGSIIRQTQTNLSDYDMTASGLPYSSQVVTISPTDANEDENFTINVSFDSRTPEQIELFFDSVTGGPFTTSESVIGTTSGTTAVITEEKTDLLLVSVPDGLFEVGETVTGQTSGASFTVTDINSIWNTL